jgi:hypothetical protein
MAYDAFISYSNHDKPVADATCAGLEASGIRCWIAPRDITPGAEWGEAIIDAINQCRVMILIFSANANNSPQIRREVERAVSKGIAIIPLRIEDVAPARSLEYFIGTVHWLDALTPPLEAHLQRLAESVKSILQIKPKPPELVGPPKVTPTIVPPASTSKPQGVPPKTIAIGALAAAVVGVGLWWLMVPRSAPSLASQAPTASAPQATVPSVESRNGSRSQPQTATGLQSQKPANPPPQARALAATTPSTPGAATIVDPAVVGAFEYSTAADGYDIHFVLSLESNGTYRMTTTSDESGTYQAGRGNYRTVGGKTGRVRTGTYRAAGPAAIAVTTGNSTVIYHPLQPTGPVDQANPVMLGPWQGTVVLAGIRWTVTLQNNPDGTYSFHGQAEDHGSCTYLNQQWHVTSAVSGQSGGGTYQVIDANTMQASGSGGNITWHRQ